MDFEDVTEVASLSVKAFDADSLTPLDFEVAKSKDGPWVIPSHHNYPADAESQLAKTATSIIGVKRSAMVTRWPSDHKRFGVVDPDQEALSIDDVEGVGKRGHSEKGR